MGMRDSQEGPGSDLLAVRLVLVDSPKESEVVWSVDGGTSQSGLVKPVRLGPFVPAVGVDDPLPEFGLEVLTGCL